MLTLETSDSYFYREYTFMNGPEGVAFYYTQAKSAALVRVNLSDLKIFHCLKTRAGRNPPLLILLTNQRIMKSDR